MQCCLHSENQRICLDQRAVAAACEAPGSQGWQPFGVLHTGHAGGSSKVYLLSGKNLSFGKELFVVWAFFQIFALRYI